VCWGLWLLGLLGLLWLWLSLEAWSLAHNRPAGCCSWCAAHVCTVAVLLLLLLLPGLLLQVLLVLQLLLKCLTARHKLGEHNLAAADADAEGRGLCKACAGTAGALWCVGAWWVQGSSACAEAAAAAAAAEPAMGKGACAGLVAAGLLHWECKGGQG
jgi:hypothetical protein